MGARIRRVIKRPTAQHSGACGVTEILSFSLLSISLSFVHNHIHIYVLESRSTAAWPPTTVAWPSSDFFQTFYELLETSEKRVLTVGRRSRVLRPLLRDRSVTFFKNFPNCLKRPKNVVWQTADCHVTSDHCRVTVQRLFSKFLRIAWNVQKRCFTVGRRSRDLRPLSRDRSVTFFEILPSCLKRRNNVVWQSANGRLTSGHFRVTVQRIFRKFQNCMERRKNVVWLSANGRVTSGHRRVTVQRLYKKFSELHETSKKRCSTVGQRSRDLRPRSSDRSSTFFKIFPNCLKRRKNVVWQSVYDRMTSDHCRVTAQRLLWKFCHFGWNVEQMLFESQRTFAWPSGYFFLVVFLRTAPHTLARGCTSRSYYSVFPAYRSAFDIFLPPNSS